MRQSTLPSRLPPLFSFLFAACLATPPSAPAGWADREPSPINADDAPGLPDIHHNSGGRRIVRIANTTIAICPRGDGNERTFRSTDDGATWTAIDSDGTYSGSLVTGPDSMVYHFYFRRGGASIQMVRFRYDAELPLPAPIPVYAAPELSTSAVPAQYANLNAVVDRDGSLYVATHWGSPDRLYVLRSDDRGATWKGPFQASSENATPWFYPHIEADGRNEMVLVYQEWNGNIGLRFGRSRDKGETWTTVAVNASENSGTAWNPSLVPKGNDSLFIFAQGTRGSASGVFSVRSVDGGRTWEKSRLVERTCRYGDVSGALGSDGALYVAFRHDLSSECGLDTREKMTMSSDGGNSWKVVDGFDKATPPTGTRSQIRYQTWWNYGGPLEWIWVQQNVGGNHLVYYDINTDVKIADRLQGESSVKPPPGGAGKGAGPHGLRYRRPSPFSRLARIDFRGTGGGGGLDLGMHDARGRLVRRIFRGPAPEADYHLRFDGRDRAGSPLAAGGYWLALGAAGASPAAVLPLLIAD